MAEFMLCRVEDTFQVTGRGLIIAPPFPVDQYRFGANQRIRVVSTDGHSFECDAFFQIPHQSPPAKVLGFFCALMGVAKDDVPIGSELWLLGHTEAEIRLG